MRRNLRVPRGALASGGGTGTRGGAGRGRLCARSFPRASASLRSPALLVPRRGHRRSNFACAEASRTCPAQNPQDHGHSGLAAAAAPSAVRAAAPRRQVSCSWAGDDVGREGLVLWRAPSMGQSSELSGPRVFFIPTSTRVCFALAALPVLRTSPTSLPLPGSCPSPSVLNAALRGCIGTARSG